MPRDSDEVDGHAWALLLTELLASAGLTPEQAGKPAGPVSVYWRTIRKWLKEESGVSAAKVVTVCRDLNYPPLEALVRVGFLTADEARLSRLPAVVSPPLPAPLRQIADVLSDPRVPEVPKTQLRRAVASALDVWAEMYKLRAPRERPAPGRSTTGGRPPNG